MAMKIGIFSYGVKENCEIPDGVGKIRACPYPLSGASPSVRIQAALFALLLILVLGNTAFAQNYVWPLSNSTTPDPMNTSFGPRINSSRWDFHDGIDLPAPIGTPVYAMREGTVYHAGPGGTGGYSSRHVVLEVNDPTDGVMYLVYLHLDSIDPAVVTGAGVTQGQLLGTVGDDGASYPHLHMEFRKGSQFEISSVHPLGYLPYTDTANFTAPVLNRFNRLGTLMAARLLFDAPSKLEGDLLRVEVDLMSGATLLETRVVDFNDKTTVNEGNGDEYIYVNDIGVEGYQTSNMVADGRTDLKYGILVRNLPSNCDTLVARVIDVGGNVATSAAIPVPNQAAIDQNVGFEDGVMPPSGWTTVTSTTGTGTTVENDTSAAFTGSRGMLSIDASTAETLTQRAGIEYELPSGRFEWIAEGWFNPTVLGLASDQNLYLLYFLSGSNLSVAARIRNSSGSMLAGIAAKDPDGTLLGSNSAAEITTNTWRKWKLHALRIGTRETTAVLYLDDVEQLRLNWDSTVFEPLKLRAGIGLTSVGATATVLSDELRVTESLTSQSADTAAAFRVDSQGTVFSNGSFNCGLQNGCFNTGLAADIAERIDVSEPVEPGDVVELDPEYPLHYRKARGPYSTLVAGVVASTPGFVLANRPEELKLDSFTEQEPKLFKRMLLHLLERQKVLVLPPFTIGTLLRPQSQGRISIALLARYLEKPERPTGRPLLALMGRVPVKATTENGPIRPGDLLVSASLPGHVMRCPDPRECEGAVLGKALEPLAQGRGIIVMLVMR
jgi:hypothetical protein